LRVKLLFAEERGRAAESSALLHIRMEKLTSCSETFDHCSSSRRARPSCSETMDHCSSSSACSSCCSETFDHCSSSRRARPAAAKHLITAAHPRRARPAAAKHLITAAHPRRARSCCPSCPQQSPSPTQALNIYFSNRCSPAFEPFSCKRCHSAHLSFPYRACTP
jgi:hypothetical protein